MPCKAYETVKFNPVQQRMIDQVIEIVDRYRADGYDLTLRQIYYQCVGHDLFPDDRKFTWTGAKWVRDPNDTKNAEPNYKWLGEIVGKGRMGGFVDWETIKDRTREHDENSPWSDPSRILDACGSQFRLDTRSTQPWYVECWVEKDALVGMIERPCRDLDVGWLSCRGYTSMTTMREAAERFIVKEREGHKTLIIHLGDHDPSGVDMSRDIQDRLKLFGSAVTLRRIALNMNQIEQYNPSPNPAKLTDSRCKAYIEQYGEESWELDALEPSVITNLIVDNVNEHTDQSKRNVLIAKQETHRRELMLAADNWSDVAEWLEERYGDTD